jgi:hypothetical protein
MVRVLNTGGLLLGALVVYWTNERTIRRSIATIPASFEGLDLQFFDAMDLTSLTEAFSLAPAREWMSGKTEAFRIGNEVFDRGQRKKHAVVLIPGIISSVSMLLDCVEISTDDARCKLSGTRIMVNVDRNATTLSH